MQLISNGWEFDSFVLPVDVTVFHPHGAKPGRYRRDLQDRHGAGLQLLLELHAGDEDLVPVYDDHCAHHP